jgi:TonB family protein
MAVKVRGLLVALCVAVSAIGTDIHATGLDATGNHVPPQIDPGIKPCAYPNGARGDETGTAVVHVWVDEKGAPTKMNISSSSGSALLDAAALECAKTSWGSAQRSGKPGKSETDVKFEWTGGQLPQTCESPVRKNSVLTIRIRLTPEAVSRVVFEHKNPAALPAGVIGQSVICACVDDVGSIKEQKLMRESGAPLLDSEAIEIGKTMAYPMGHPGCMRDTINFAGPDE